MLKYYPLAKPKTYYCLYGSECYYEEPYAEKPHVRICEGLRLRGLSLLDSLEEAAMIDGCSIMQIYFKIVFPVIRPIIMTVAILNAMWIWNDYLLPYLVIGSEYKTISVAIQYLRGGYGSIDLGLMMSMLVLAIIPIVIFYMICQKWIIQGVIAGAVKG